MPPTDDSSSTGSTGAEQYYSSKRFNFLNLHGNPRHTSFTTGGCPRKKLEKKSLTVLTSILLLYCRAYIPVYFVQHHADIL